MYHCCARNLHPKLQETCCFLIFRGITFLFHCVWPAHGYCNDMSNCCCLHVTYTGYSFWESRPFYLFCLPCCLVDLTHSVCLISCLCAKRPPRKPRRGQQREPTPMCSPCLSRPRSRNSKRWEMLNHFKFHWSFIWQRIGIADGVRTRPTVSWGLLSEGFLFFNTWRFPLLLTLWVFPFSLFIVVVCPPVYFSHPCLHGTEACGMLVWALVVPRHPDCVISD